MNFRKKKLFAALFEIHLTSDFLPRFNTGQKYGVVAHFLLLQISYIFLKGRFSNSYPDQIKTYTFVLHKNTYLELAPQVVPS